MITSHLLRRRARLFLLLAFLWLPAVAPALEFQVERPAADDQAPITGRLFVFLSQRDQGEPRFGPNWFQPEPFFGLEVKDFAPGQSRTVDDQADSFPAPLSKLPPGKYRAQALLDHDFYESSPALGVGNLYSDVVEFELADGQPSQVTLALTQTVAARTFPEHPRVREVVLRSELLSSFHNREVLQHAAVVLPEHYDQHPDRRYPVIYSISGFGGSHYDAFAYLRRTEKAPSVDANELPEPAADAPAVEFIRVFLNARCKWGHHVFADSATNGPRGRALVEELIPHLDHNFRTVAASTARFLTGVSSGGWSSLWLQVTHPETFGGVWSIVPDPVDFRDYQQVDLYANPPQSLYTDEQGQRRPLARRGDQVVIWYGDFARMDDVLGRGGQLRSFEAVFSPLDANGLPQRMWDRTSGRVDPAVAQAWELYDVSLVLQRDWDRLGPLLQGKLHIFAGELDTFYLEGAVRLLSDRLKGLGSDAVIEIIPGKGHGDVLDPEMADRILAEMSAAYLAHHGPR
jgi:hypothetical protein